MSITKNTYQIFWKCPSCGTKDLLGITHRHCPNCGDAQDESTRYFPPEGQEVLLEKHIYYGVDWDCQYCDTPNSKNSNNCVNCGGPHEGSFEVKLIDKSSKDKKLSRTKSPAQTPMVMEQSISLKNSNSSQKVSSSSSKRDNSFNTIFIILGIIFAFFIGFLIYGSFKITDEAVTVTTKTWQRSISTEEYRSINDDAWCSSMPFDAYSVSRNREVRSHKQIAAGETCSVHRKDNGDGSYSKIQSCSTKYRSEPVYDMRCRYKVNRWRFNNEILASGNDNNKPHWPNMNHLQLNSSEILGNIRQGSSKESYMISYLHKTAKDSDTYRCGYSQKTWESLKVNNHYKAQIRMIGGLICSSVIDIDAVRSK